MPEFTDEGHPDLNVLTFRVRELHRRVGLVEKDLDDYDPKVTAERISTLAREVRQLKRAVTVFTLSIVGSAITFAFGAITLALTLGGH